MGTFSSIGPWGHFRRVALVALAGTACLTGLRQDEIECELANEYLVNCCGVFTGDLNCAYQYRRGCGYGDSVTLPVSLDLSTCIQRLGCDDLVASGACQFPQAALDACGMGSGAGGTTGGGNLGHCGCNDPNDCNNDAPFCVSNQRCGTVCTSGIDCPGTGTQRVCSAGQECVECTIDADCSGSATCLNGLCRGCTTSADCPSEAPSCVSGQCGCSVDADCAAEGGRCVGGECFCAVDADCPGQQICVR